jgi:hypothetical protein
VDSQHYNQTNGPWTVNTTCKQGVRWTVSTTFSWAVDRQHHLQSVHWSALHSNSWAADSQRYTQTFGPWTVSTTFKQLGRGQTAPPSNKGPGRQSPLHSNRCAVESQHYLQTVGPWTDSTTFKQGARWTFSTTFKELGRGQSAPPSNKVCSGKSALPSNRWPWTVNITFKQGVRWTVSTTFSWAVQKKRYLQTRRVVHSTTFKQACRGQFFGRDLVILTGIHALSKSFCVW